MEFRIRGLGRAKQAVRTLRSRLVAGGVILLYHRVTALTSDPQALSVSPEHFAAQLDLLQRHYRPMRLQDLAKAAQAGNVPRGAVAVTFDDGYADNLCEAAPILERYDVPATVFVASGYSNQTNEFYWDALEQLLLHNEQLPPSLSLPVGERTVEWELGDDARATTASVPSTWSLLEQHDPGMRQQIYRSLGEELRPLPGDQQRCTLEALAAWAGKPLVIRPTHRTMTPEEVARLAAGGLVEIGAHTVTHSRLSALTSNQSRTEIEGSKVQLEAIIQKPVKSFSYPYGTLADYTAETIAQVRQAGFSLACSNFEDSVWRRSDPYQLPRILVRDVGADALDRLLGRWIH